MDHRQAVIARSREVFGGSMNEVLRTVRQDSEVLELQVSGRYLDRGTAIPLWKLRDLPLIKNAGVTFSEVSSAELQSICGAVEQIARTRYWAKLRAVVKDILQQAVHE
jgi:hypothetical protein